MLKKKTSSLYSVHPGVMMVQKIETGGFAKKDRITHRIPITTLADIDAEVLNWLQTAYKRDI